MKTFLGFTTGFMGGFMGGAFAGMAFMAFMLLKSEGLREYVNGLADDTYDR